MTAPRKNGKTGSRNPAAKPTSVSAWKKSIQAPPIELPSGHYMRIRKVGLPVLMQTGMMPNSLMAIAQRAVSKGQGKPQEVSDDELAEMAMDPKKVQELADFIDRMVVFVAQEPEVYPIPEEHVARDEDTLYVDEVDYDDKMFIFQVVTGGTTDLEQFRGQHTSAMAALRGSENLELPTE